jgi:hypothetical protein
MKQKQRHPESHGKGGVSAGKPLTKGEAKEAMIRFESLTRRLLAVPREQILEEKIRHGKESTFRKSPVK